MMFKGINKALVLQKVILKVDLNCYITAEIHACPYES